MPRWLKWTLGVLGGLLLLVGIGVFVLTQTDFGRERVRRLALEQLAGSVHGRVRIGEVSGNLLSGATLTDVVITDSTGAPFLDADTVSLGYSLGSLLSQKIYLSDVRLVHPVVVLEKRPGEEWNFARIFPSDTVAQEDTTTGGFGSRVRIRDLVVRDGRLLVRNEWTPTDSLSGAARDSAIAEALSPENRLRVVRVAGGFQSLQDFRELNTRMPLLRLADPDSADIVVDVARLSTVALAFRPPAAIVRDLAGRFVVSEDSIHFRDVRVAFPGSRLAADGAFASESGDLRATLSAAPLALADLRWLYPPLPDSSGGNLRLAVARRGERTRVVARGVDLHAEGARLAGHADVQFGDSLRLGDTDVRFSGIDTRLVERFAPDAEVPVDGILRGRLALRGSPDALRVDGGVAFEQRGGATSRLFADGEIGTGDGFRAQNLRVRFDPVQVALARGFQPDLPVGGTIVGEATLNGSTATGLAVDADLVHRDPRVGRSRLLADGEIETADGLAARDLTLRFEPLQLALARAFAPDLEVRGTLSGRATLNGTAERLAVDADLTHRDPRFGRSRLLASGGVSTGEDGFAARDLTLRFEPVQVALARAFAPDFPLGGTLSGRATINGSTATRFGVNTDLVHRGATGRSHLVGDVRVALGEPRRFYVDLRALPVSLATVGRFAPSAGLRGSATGSLRAEGTLSELALGLRLAVADGGSVDAQGTFDLASAEKEYDFRSRFDAFDAGALSARAPRTSLTGTIAAEGRGFDPATARARLVADLTGARVDSVGVDSVRIRARVADGLATVERAVVRLASAEAQVNGSFGLVAGRNGTLSYLVRVDSLSDFADYLPADSGTVQPRPAEFARAMERARADEVERAATGLPAEPTPRVDSVPPLPRDSLSGRVELSGTLVGNPERFDVRGRAALDRVVALGNTLGSGRIDYQWLDAPGERSSLALDAGLDSVRAAGFALDSIGARVRYRGRVGEGSGTVDLAVVQDPRRDYRAKVDFDLALNQGRVRLDDVLLRFDTTRWTSTQPGVVSWGGNGVEVRTIELRSGDGGRIYLNGTLPEEGAADLQLAIDRLQIGDVAALLQDSLDARGRFSLAARLRGTRANPRLVGTAALTEAAVDTIALPDLQARFDYAGRLLAAHAEALRGGRALLVADARVPVDLALSGVEGERLLNRPLVVDVRADSLPLDALPSFSDAVEDVRGRLAADVAVRGTPREPEVNGRVELDLGSLTVVPAGLALEDIAGTVRLAGDTVVVDSLVAHSDGGPIRLAGGVDVSTLSEPGFALRLTADGARVLDNEQGRVRADADIRIEGPFEAVRVGGDVRIRSGVIYIPEGDGAERIDRDDPALAALMDSTALDPEVVPPPNPLLENLQVDVNVAIDRDTWVRNTDANVEIYTPAEVGALSVNLDRRSQALTLEGTINTDRGEYGFSGRRFQLTSGSVVFLGTPELNPLLQLTAQNQVIIPGRPALAIRIVVGGTLQEPRISLESDAQPPIAQSDLLSYLAFGTSSSSLLPQGGSGVGGGGSGSSGLTGTVSGLYTQQLAGVAVGALVEDLESGGTRELGLDVFHITPAELPGELGLSGWGNLLRGTEVEIGKYLTSRWFIAAQARPTDVLPGARIEYRTPQGFRWVTSWEPRFLPSQPTLADDQEVTSESVFGSFLLWEWRY